MKNKKSLISLLLAAVLLCACVAGMLIFGAQAEGSNLELTVAEGESITAALSAVTAGEKEGKDAIVITLEGNAVEDDAATLFSETNVGLPIIINGSGKTVTANVLSAGPITSVNDITLNGVTLVTNATQLNLGNRKVVLDGATIPVGILLNEGENVTADSSLTVRGGTVIGGNLFLLAGQTKLNQGITTSLFFEEGKVSGMVFGAVDSAEIGGTLNMQMKYANASFQDRYYGIGGNATVAAEGTLNFTVDGANLSDSTDYAVAVYGFDLSGNKSLPIVEGEVNFVSTPATVIKTVNFHVLSSNVDLKEGGSLNATVAGNAYVAVKVIYFSKNTGSTTKINGSISIEFENFVTVNKVATYGISIADSINARANVSNAIQNENLTLRFCYGKGVHLTQYSAAIRSDNKSTFASLKCNVLVEITGGTYAAELRSLWYIELNGNVTTHVYTTKSIDSDENVNTDGINSTSQMDATWSSVVNGKSILKVNGGTARNIKFASYSQSYATTVENYIKNTDPQNGFELYPCRNTTSCSIKNVLENTYCKIFTGGGINNKALNANVDNVENDLTNTKVDYFYGFVGTNKGSSKITGNITNHFRAGCEFTTSFYSVAPTTTTQTGENTVVTTTIEPGCTFKGAVKLEHNSVPHNTTIQGGTFESSVTGGDITVENGIFKGSISAVNLTLQSAEVYAPVTASNSLVLAGGTITSALSKGECCIKATDIENKTIFAKHEDYMFYDEDLMLTFPTEDESLLEVEFTNASRGYTTVVDNQNGTATLKSHLLPILAQLVLEERTVIRFLIAESDLQHAIDNNKGFFLWSGFGQKEISFDPVTLPTCEWEGVTYRYLEMQGFGADQFDNENFFYTSVTNGQSKISVNSLATAGSEMDNISQEEKELFLALLDYGKAAEGTLQELTTNIDVVDDIPEGLGSTPGSGAVQFANKTLLMGDTIGIRLTMNLANTTGKIGSVWYYDTDITNLCVIDETKGTLDLFVNAKNLSSVLKITVKDEAGNTCLVLVDTVKHIAKQLVDSNPVDQAVKMKAEATLALIQAVQNYAF